MGNGEVVLPLAVSVVAGVDLFLDLDGKVVVVPTGGVAGVAVGGEEVGMPVGGAVSTGGVAGVVVGSGELP